MNSEQKHEIITSQLFISQSKCKKSMYFSFHVKSYLTFSSLLFSNKSLTNRWMSHLSAQKNSEATRLNQLYVTSRYFPCKPTACKIFTTLFYNLMTIYLFSDNKININICMNEVSISTSSHSSFYSHQTVFFSVLKDGIRFKVFCVSRIGFICFNPTNVLATTKAPFL